MTDIFDFFSQEAILALSIFIILIIMALLCIIRKRGHVITTIVCSYLAIIVAVMLLNNFTSLDNTFCGKCYLQVDFTDKYCLGCGGELKENKYVPIHSEYYFREYKCPDCNQSYDAPHNYCEECGGNSIRKNDAPNFCHSEIILIKLVVWIFLESFIATMFLINFFQTEKEEGWM